MLFSSWSFNTQPKKVLNKIQHRCVCVAFTVGHPFDLRRVSSGSIWDRIQQTCRCMYSYNMCVVELLELCVVVLLVVETMVVMTRYWRGCGRCDTYLFAISALPSSTKHCEHKHVYELGETYSNETSVRRTQSTSQQATHFGCAGLRRGTQRDRPKPELYFSAKTLVTQMDRETPSSSSTSSSEAAARRRRRQQQHQQRAIYECRCRCLRWHRIRIANYEPNQEVLVRGHSACRQTCDAHNSFVSVV